MTWVLLAGVALNWLGALRLASRAWTARPETPAADALLYEWFTVGTATVFGAMYLYLYLEPSYAVPFLVFGAALKTWALVISTGLWRAGRLPLKALVEFGGSNAVVAALFWTYLATERWTA